MQGYSEPYLEVARRHSVGFVLEANTWRANPAWGASSATRRRSRRGRTAAVGFVADPQREEAPGRPIVLSAPIGPQDDAYDPEGRLTAAEAEAFDSGQAGVLAEIAADIAGALTITYAEEAIGIVRAATKMVSQSPRRSPSKPMHGSRADSPGPRRSSRSTPDPSLAGVLHCQLPPSDHFLPVLHGPGPWRRVSYPCKRVHQEPCRA